MTKRDTQAQLAILADALTRIIETASLGSASTTAESEVLERNGDIAAQALIAAATFGPLPASSLR